MNVSVFVRGFQTLGTYGGKWWIGVAMEKSDDNSVTVLSNSCILKADHHPSNEHRRMTFVGLK
jgi:hypothetical protein